MKNNYPFVYIASLMRSGSTMMQESLTKVPFSYMFCEPKFGKNMFKISPRFLKDLPFDVRPHLKPPCVRTFAKNVVPKLKVKISQVGIKEIRNAGWRQYLKYFPDMKFVLTGRDPRDIYISANDWFANRSNHFLKKGGILIPEKLLAEVINEVKSQKEMFETGQAIRVKYEDLCQDSESVMSEVKEFVNSPIPDIGDIGGYLSLNQKRMNEFQRHGKNITSLRIQRWKKVRDKGLLSRAKKFYSLMKEYRAFWSY
jgi:hypothetical protein